MVDEKMAAGAMTAFQKTTLILKWAMTRPDFDKSYVESLRLRIERGRDLTKTQEQALDSIITRWGLGG